MNQKNSFYRPDIDGLRAIAVLAVVAFHAFPLKIKGGFVGVDVFFVISGFLISGHIFSSLKQGSFSFSDFYARRIRRIFPSLIAVLGLTSIVGWFLLAPDQLKEFGKHLMGGVSFIANFIFWREAGYFDDLAEQKPLLHLWSLAIEEQFYIFWPLILFFIWKFTKKLMPTLLGILIISFFWNLLKIDTDPSGTFYFPMTRVWELLIGAGLALYQQRTVESNTSPEKSSTQNYANIFSIVGAGLIFYSIAFIEKANFPGWNALFPTVGSFLIIYAGNTAWFNRNILSKPILVGIGLISYPLYLWHWPILCFIRQFTSAKPGLRLAAILVSIGLSWLTYKFIEKPIRSPMGSKLKIPLLCMGMILLFGIGATMYVTNGFPDRFPKHISAMMAKYDSRVTYRFDTCFKNTYEFDAFSTECVELLPENAPLVLLWGDSLAAHLYPGLRELQKSKSFRIAQLTATSCPPLIGGATGENGKCPEILDLILERIKEIKPQTVILGSRWSRDSRDLKAKLNLTVKFLREQGVAQIILVGPTPNWLPTLKTILFKNHLKGQDVPLRMEPAKEFFAITTKEDDELRKLTQELQIEYASPLKVFCEDSQCLVHVGLTWPEELFTADHDHFTSGSSIYFMKTLNLFK